MSQLTAEELANIASLNSVSAAALQADGSYVRDFTGNDLAFAHTVEETERKKFSTQPELNDEDLVKKAAAEDAAEAEAANGQEENA